MKSNLYTIYDTASGIYWKPMTAQSDAEMARGFGDIALNAEHPVGQHPEDYTLFRIGVYDDNTGKISPETPESICTALEMVSKAQTIKPGSLKEYDDDITHLTPGGTQ